MLANPIGLLLRSRRAGQHLLAWARTDLRAPEEITVTSPAFAHGAAIPDRHRGRVGRPNISPPLAWTAPPAGTVDLVLVVQDPDVPFGSPAVHGLAVGIDPTLTGLPENGLADPSPVRGLRNGRGLLGRRGYAGPLPVRSHGPHIYVFQLFAVDRRLELPDSFTLAQALDAMAGHVLARGRLDGTYEIR